MSPYHIEQENYDFLNFEDSDYRIILLIDSFRALYQISVYFESNLNYIIEDLKRKIEYNSNLRHF